MTLTGGREMRDVAEYFRDGTHSCVNGMDAVARVHRVGTLLVPSGSLAVCDPFVGFNARPLKRRIPAGEYPVLVSVMALPSGDERVALALLKLSERKAARWEVADFERDPTDVAHATMGYGVDSGVGCFSTTEALRSSTDAHYVEQLLGALEKNGVDTWSWADVRVDDRTPNVVAFSSGWGDGVYVSYWGLDSSGEICALLTDFRVLDDAADSAPRQ